MEKNVEPIFFIFKVVYGNRSGFYIVPGTFPPPPPPAGGGGGGGRSGGYGKWARSMGLLREKISLFKKRGGKLLFI